MLSFRIPYWKGRRLDPKLCFSSGWSMAWPADPWPAFSSFIFVFFPFPPFFWSRLWWVEWLSQRRRYWMYRLHEHAEKDGCHNVQLFGTKTCVLAMGFEKYESSGRRLDKKATKTTFETGLEYWPLNYKPKWIVTKHYFNLFLPRDETIWRKWICSTKRGIQPHLQLSWKS